MRSESSESLPSRVDDAGIKEKPVQSLQLWSRPARRELRRTACLVDGLLWGYVLGLVLWVVLRSACGDRAFFVLILSYTGVWLFSPVLFFAPWVLLRRRRIGALALVVPLALFFGFYAPFFLPHTPPTDDPVDPFTVLTFNLGHNDAAVEALVAKLPTLQADVLSLQEVAPGQQQRLSQTLEKDFPYHFYDAPAGLVVYSHYPILKRTILPMQPWSAQSVVIQIHEASLHLINAHLAQVGLLRYFEAIDGSLIRELAQDREAQITQIQTTIRETGLPAVVACDCNMTDLMSAYTQMTATLRDAHREQGRGFGHTFLVPRGLGIPSPFNLAVQRIDYLFFSPQVQVLQVKVLGGESFSDHLPLWGQFDLCP